MNEAGSKVWLFPDGYIPRKTNDGETDSHEALMILNVNSREAEISIDIFFEDKEPIFGISKSVPPCRVMTIHLDKPDDLGGIFIPSCKQYALRVSSTVDVVMQMGRADATQKNLAYYSSSGFSVRG